MSAPNDEPAWADGIESLRRRTAVAAALENADLLESAAGQWRGRVVARTSMHDLLFTRPGERFPFESSVRVSFDPDEETFTFTRRSPDGVVAEDIVRRDSALAVLDAFLAQLASD